MSIARSIVRNTTWLFAAEIISMILLTIGNLLLIRYFGDTTFGKYGFVISFVSLFSFLVDFGLPILLVNEVSQDKQLLSRYLGNFLSLKIILGFVVSIITVATIFLIEKSAEIKMLVAIWSLNTILISFVTLLYGVFRIFEQMKYEGLFKVSNNILNILIILIIVIAHLTLFNFIILNIIISLILLIIIIIFIQRKYASFALSWDIIFLKQIVKKASPLIFGIAFINIYYGIASVMLKYFKSNEVVGWYNADYRIVFPILTFIGLYYSVIFPIISKLHKVDREKISLIIQVTIKVMIIFFLPSVFTVSFLAKPLVILLFGEEFINAHSALTILIWVVFISSISMMFSSIFLAFGKRKIYLIATAIGAIGNVLFNLILIPKFSLEGAALSGVISELCIISYFRLVFNKQIFPISIWRQFIKPIISTILIIPVIYLSFTLTANVIIAILTTAIAYTLIIILIKGVTINELKQFWQYVQPVKLTKGI